MDKTYIWSYQSLDSKIWTGIDANALWMGLSGDIVIAASYECYVEGEGFPWDDAGDDVFLNRLQFRSEECLRVPFEFMNWETGEVSRNEADAAAWIDEGIRVSLTGYVDDRGEFCRFRRFYAAAPAEV